MQVPCRASKLASQTSCLASLGSICKGLSTKWTLLEDDNQHQCGASKVCTCMCTYSLTNTPQSNRMLIGEMTD